MISVIDYGAGNLQSVVKALQFIGCEPHITCDRDEILASDHVILPGVGSFGDCMASLKKNHTDRAVIEAIEQGKPFLGICLGMQMLFEGSEESPGVSGLGILKGVIRKIPVDPSLKIPHMGWNSLNILQSDGILAGLPQSAYVYFVHSYYLHAEDPAIVSAQTTYGTTIDAAVQQGNIHATQFHPEKSSRAGLQILKNFVAL
ncbi:MAG: imidazole glycerol phosphate synthase subunit HisH [Firmicutes bacterium]|nr:imidazole glycerol phosphate synthase subunit HisH [Bacillota bacterium]